MAGATHIAMTQDELALVRQYRALAAPGRRALLAVGAALVPVAEASVPVAQVVVDEAAVRRWIVDAVREAMGGRR